eukprot:g25880.t1
MALTVWLLPETLDALSCHEAGPRCKEEELLSLAALERLPFDPRSWSLRRLELGVEALQGVHLLPSPSSLQELCLQHLLVPSVPYRGAVFGRFWELVAELPSLRTLELPDLICTAGGSETFASQLSKHLGTSLLRLRLHRAVLLECRSRESSFSHRITSVLRCQNVLSSFLEIGYDPDRPPELPKAPPVTSPRSRASIGGGRSSLPVPVVPATISTWVKNLVTAEVDLDRGDMVDKLIKYDEQRLAQENGAVAESLFSHGRTIPVLLGRLNLTSHYTLHERRTPLRTHLLKFLLNILSRSDPADTERPDDSRSPQLDPVEFLDFECHTRACKA